MAKVSANYEVLYIINPTLGEEDTAALVEKYQLDGKGIYAQVKKFLNK